MRRHRRAKPTVQSQQPHLAVGLRELKAKLHEEIRQVQRPRPRRVIGPETRLEHVECLRDFIEGLENRQALQKSRAVLEAPLLDARGNARDRFQN